MKNNKGFSLVELIVVIAIMAIMISLVGLGISAISGQRLKSSANETKYLLQSSQTVAMSKADCIISLQKVGDEVIIRACAKKGGAYTNQLSEVVVKDKVQVKVITSDTGGCSKEYAVGTTELILGYNRENGSFKSIKEGNVEKSGETPTGISFTGSGTTITLEVSEFTGKISTK